MPARDVAHGVGSREANVLAGIDMLWLSEAVDARGGLGPDVDSHVMRAADLQDVFTGMHALTGAWIVPSFSAADVWDSLLHFVGDGVKAEDLRDCPSGVASGMPMVGAHMRTAFWNAEQREVFSPFQEAGTGYYTATYSEAGKTFEAVGARIPSPAPGMFDIYSRRVTSGATEGYRVSGGSCTVAGNLPSNIGELTVEAMYALLGFTVGAASGLSACMLLDSDAYRIAYGQITGDLVKIRDVAMRGLTHFGWSTDSAYGWAGLYGLLPILRVREGSRLSDLGWTWSPI